MQGLLSSYNDLWEIQVKPQRINYSMEALNLENNKIEGTNITREDFEVRNAMGYKIVGSFYYPTKYQEKARGINGQYSAFDNIRKTIGNDTEEKISEIIDAKDLPVLIYCHSHSGSRVEGIDLVDVFCPDFGVVLFDFSGCGHSEGEYVTLGIKEQDDLRVVIQWQKKRN